MNISILRLVALSLILPAAAAQLRWTQYAPGTGPAARQGASLAFDAQRGRMVLYGGASDGGGTLTWRTDTWEWDGTAWSQVPAVGLARTFGASMTYDRSLGRIVLLVPGAAPVLLTYDGSSWRGLGDPAPPADAWKIVADERRGILLTISPAGAVYERTQTSFGIRWRQAAASGPSPSGGAVFDVAMGVTIVVDPSARGSTGVFAWDGTTWTEQPSEPLPFRQVDATVHDRRRQRLVVATEFGLYERAGSRWLGVPNPSLPPGCSRAFAAWGYDAAHGHLLVLGGGCGLWGNTMSLDDVQSLAPTARGGVQERSAVCPSAAGAPYMVAEGVPLLGNDDFALQLSGLLPGNSALLAVGPRASRVPLGSCFLYVNPTLALPLQADAFGRARARLPIPLDPRLRWLGYSAQAVTFAAAPLAFAASQELAIQIGD
ncbi:MAG: hypothetical protein R3F56_08940 [Planctomycetota bacterium]